MAMPIGVELLEAVELLARADELDRHAGDRPQRERGATARVAVHLGQDDAGEPDVLVELLGDLTASWPVMASATSSTSCGLTRPRISASSRISSSSICGRPAVSRMT